MSESAEDRPRAMRLLSVLLGFQGVSAIGLAIAIVTMLPSVRRYGGAPV